MAQYQCSRGHKWEEDRTQTDSFSIQPPPFGYSMQFVLPGGVDEKRFYCYFCILEFLDIHLGTVQEAEAPHDAPVFVSH